MASGKKESMARERKEPRADDEDEVGEGKAREQKRADERKASKRGDR